VTTYTPTNTFTGGPNPPSPIDYRENVYDPQAPPALYNRTTTFGSMDIINGWLDSTLMAEGIQTRKLKDESCTQVFKIAQNLNLDYKEVQKLSPAPHPIPGMCADIFLKWPAKVLILYNIVAANAGYFNAADPTDAKMLELYIRINGLPTIEKDIANIRPSYDINPANVPGLYGYIGRESINSSLCLNLAAGRQTIETSLYSNARLVRLSCRQLTILAFRRSS